VATAAAFSLNVRLNGRPGPLRFNALTVRVNSQATPASARLPVAFVTPTVGAESILALTLLLYR
jgi:hypothetical protein